jgi:Phage Tail Collar Domain
VQNLILTGGDQPVVNKIEITPRIAFLTTPYAHVANTASRVVQQPGTSSSLMISGIGYATRVEDAGSATINLTLDQRTNLIAAGPTGTTANLPANGDSHELLISKTDDTPQFVTIAPPAGGQINGSTNSIRLKVKGESVTLQNAGGNAWWVVDDTRDNTPVGTIVTYGGQEPPPGYLPCDGSTPLRTDYAELFATVGTLWGTTADVSPDVCSVVPVPHSLSAPCSQTS